MIEMFHSGFLFRCKSDHCWLWYEVLERLYRETDCMTKNLRLMKCMNTKRKDWMFWFVMLELLTNSNTICIPICLHCQSQLGMDFYSIANASSDWIDSLSSCLSYPIHTQMHLGQNTENRCTNYNFLCGWTIVRTFQGFLFWVGWEMIYLIAMHWLNYFSRDCIVETVSSLCKNDALADQLWKISSKAVALEMYSHQSSID